MRIVHVRRGSHPHPGPLPSRERGKLGGTTKFGMLRLTLGRVRAGSNACEASMRWVPVYAGRIRVVKINNGDQEV